MKKILLLLVLSCGCLTVGAVENYPYRSDYLWLTVPDHADWLYKVGEKAKVEVTFCLYGMPQDVEVSYEIGPDMMPATSQGKVKLKNGRAVIDMGTMKKPGFLDLRLTIEGDQTTPPSAPLLLRRGIRYQHHVKVGFSPEQLKPYTKTPADFDAFWKANLEEARKAPLHVDCKKVDSYCTDETDMYLLKIKYDQRHSIYAYLSKPKECSMFNGQCSI